MSKIDLSKKLKVVTSSRQLTTGLWAEAFPIGLAKDEILLIHASKVIVYRTASGGWNTRLFLYKKTENVPATSAWSVHDETGGWTTDDSVLDAWFYIGNTVRTSEPLPPVINAYQIYPKPLVLIRPPSYLHYGTEGTSASITLWYSTEKVSDKNLLELMVKDHA